MITSGDEEQYLMKFRTMKHRISLTIVSIQMGELVEVVTAVAIAFVLLVTF